MVSNSRISVRSGSDSTSNYNPRATPFYPSSFKVLSEGENFEASPGYVEEVAQLMQLQHLQQLPHHYLPPQPFPSMVNPGPSLVCNIEISNFGNKTKQTTFQELLDSIVGTLSHDDGEGDYSAADYEMIQYSSEEPTKDSDVEYDTDEDETEENGNSKELKPQAVIQVTWPLAYKLMEAFHGYEWHGKTLEAKILSDASQSRSYNPQANGSIPPGISSGSSRSSRNSSIGGGSFYNPYYPMYAPGMPYNHSSYDYNQYNHLPHQQILYQQQQHQQQQHHQLHNEQLPPYPNWTDFSGAPPPPPSRGYLSRRPSNRSTEKSPQLLLQHLLPNIHRSSSISSSSSNPAGVPPFIMNLVNSNHEGTSASKEVTSSASGEQGSDEPSLYDQMQQNFNSSRNEAIYITNEDGQTVKVNPKRLFVGNIPFTSTWPALKNFLVTKSEEIEPDNNIEILRVEIPMQPQTTVKNAYGGSDFYLDNELKQRPDMIHGGGVGSSGSGRGMSRGFAIVTTGNQESSEKLIKYFDDVDFEGRKLTVRFDKFPDFNNYLLQQLYPYSKNNMNSNIPNNSLNSSGLYGPNGIPKSNVLSNLAFERNLFQQKFYYGRGAGVGYPSGGNSSSPHLHMPMMYYPGVYYNNPGIISPTVPPPVPPLPIHMAGIPASNHSGAQGSKQTPRESISPQNGQSDQSPLETQRSHLPEYVPSKLRLPPPTTERQFDLKSSSSQKLPDTIPNTSGKVPSLSKKRKSTIPNTEIESGNVNDDQKARELVNSFLSLGMSS